MPKEIDLTQGYKAIVDDSDYELVSRYKWCVSSGETVKYARRGTLKREPHYSTEIQMHRFILGTKRGIEIDHINGNGLDNRRENLRATDRFGQMRNTPKKRTPSISMFKGVSRSKGCNNWVAYIRKDGRLFHLGSFLSEEDAALAYDFEAKKIFGEFARLNFPHRDQCL